MERVMDLTFVIIIASCVAGIVILLLLMPHADRLDDERRSRSSRPDRINPWVWVILGCLGLIVLIGNIVKYSAGG
jgi:hypothetical protein